MSREALSIPPVVLFADPAQETWGVAVGGDQTASALGPLDASLDSSPAELQLESPTGRWTLRGVGGELTISPVPAATVGEDGDGGLTPIHVTGGRLGDPEIPEAGGVRHPGWAETKADSVRLLCAWFPAERAIALAAVRPRGARGQERDEIGVACVGEPEDLTVFDPRLSSTYDQAGHLRRVGVELWLGENEDADLHSLRMAGEATGATASLDVDGLLVQAQPFVCHSRGESGLGVYALITRR